MAEPAPALLALRDAVNARWPLRNKASDGIMGDAAHQAAGTSDHNEGNALDITFDATNGPDLEALAEALIQDARVRYIIWNKRIRNREYEAGAWRAYSGASPHTAHMHVSVYADRRSDTSPWDFSAKAPALMPSALSFAAIDPKPAVVFVAVVVGAGALLAAFSLLNREPASPVWSWS